MQYQHLINPVVQAPVSGNIYKHALFGFQRLTKRSLAKRPPVKKRTFLCLRMRRKKGIQSRTKQDAKNQRPQIFFVLGHGYGASVKKKGYHDSPADKHITCPHSLTSSDMSQRQDPSIRRTSARRSFPIHGPGLGNQRATPGTILIDSHGMLSRTRQDVHGQ